MPPVIRSLTTRLLACGPVAAALLAGGAAAVAQDLVDNPPDAYHPLNQRTPPGVAAQWFAFQGKATPLYFQPVKVELPGAGKVTVFGPTPQTTAQLAAPAQAAMAVGHLYRLKLSEMPDYPGVELYPTIEMLDRLHPPPGQAHLFPIPVQFTAEEIEFALRGRLVTRVVYVEQPQLAVPVAQEPAPRILTIANHRNLLAEADLLGRPVLIIRLGGRVPDPTGTPDPAFFGTGAPPVFLGPAATN